MALEIWEIGLEGSICGADRLELWAAACLGPRPGKRAVSWGGCQCPATRWVGPMGRWRARAGRWMGQPHLPGNGCWDVSAGAEGARGQLAGGLGALSQEAQPQHRGREWQARPFPHQV